MKYAMQVIIACAISINLKERLSFVTKGASLESKIQKKNRRLVTARSSAGSLRRGRAASHELHLPAVDAPIDLFLEYLLHVDADRPPTVLA